MSGSCNLPGEEPGVAEAPLGRQGRIWKLGPIPPAQPGSREASMGMAKTEQGLVTRELPRVPPGRAQIWQGWREHAMDGAGPNGPGMG